MTTAADFHAALRADRDAHHARLVFADWLDERDDPRGPGYRALGMLGRRPAYCNTEPTWFNAADTRVGGREGPEDLPRDWFLLLEGWDDNDGTYWRDWAGSGDAQARAEDAAALAFARLPPERQAYLLTPGADVYA